MRIAIAHDSITQMGGAERVLKALHELYPEAPVFTLVYDRKLSGYFDGWTIVSSPLQYLYNLVPKFKLMLPFIPAAIRFFDFSGFDVVLSTSSAFIKNIMPPKGVIHICYCHTPARFLWLETDSYLRDEAPGWLRPCLRMFLKYMRKWDMAGSKRVTAFIANSKNVSQRIKNIYGRDSAVIYPGVDTGLFYPTAQKGNFCLLAARQQAHKRSDLVIKAFNESGKELHVAGSGRAMDHLRAMAKSNIKFLGRLSDHSLVDEYSAANVFIFPQEEDFGLAPLEAMACGTPVAAYARGGALETVIPGKTGVLFDEQTDDAINEALDQLSKMNIKQEDLFEQAHRFSQEKFESQIKAFVEGIYAAGN
ncbi:glycosyltransferase [Patescibacteria group bacterium]|nr:glycosyltransferase [Patescibacteria group bacterium]